jgi:hypothetical protein
MDDAIFVVHRLHQHRMSFVPISHLVPRAYLRASRHPFGPPRKGSTSLAPLLTGRQSGGAGHTTSTRPDFFTLTANVAVPFPTPCPDSGTRADCTVLPP